MDEEISPGGMGYEADGRPPLRGEGSHRVAFGKVVGADVCGEQFAKRQHIGGRKRMMRR